MDEILKKAYETHSLEAAEIEAILRNEDINEKLFFLADKTRKEFVGDEVHLRALIEFSNICRQNCLYCGIRRENEKIHRFRLSKEKIIALAKKAAAQGFKTVVLQSGEDTYFGAKKLEPVIREIKKLNLAITLSIGELKKEEYKTLKEAGANRFLLRIETTNPELYKKFHPEMSLKNRVNCLKTLKELGFETGTGIIVGLPSQTDRDLARDILFFKEIDADMIGLGPLIVSKNTPLKDNNNGSLIKSLKVMALTRLLLPDINIPATTAMETLDSKGRIAALQAGANVIMPNVGGDEKEFYEIYPDKGQANKEIDTREKTIEMIENIGRKVSKDFGFRKKS